MLFAITFVLFQQLRLVPAAKQLQRTVTPQSLARRKRVISLCARAALDTWSRGR